MSNLSNLELNLELNLEPGTESGTVWHLIMSASNSEFGMDNMYSDTKQRQDGKSKKHTTYSPSSAAQIKGAITVTEEEIGHGLRLSWTGPASIDVSSGVVGNGTTGFRQLK